MADVVTYDELMELISDGYGSQETFYADYQATVSNPATENFLGGKKIHAPVLPSLPGDVTKYRMTSATGITSLSTSVLSFYKAINLGSLTLGDGAGGDSSFADGDAMPTVTQLGNSVTQLGAILAEVTTALTTTPGTYTVTYTDQDGNSSTTAAVTPTGDAIKGSVGFVKLADGDFGVRDITASARSSGTNPGGVIKFWGVVPLGMCQMGVSTGVIPAYLNPLTSGFNFLQLNAGDQILVIQSGLGGASGTYGKYWLVGER